MREKNFPFSSCTLKKWKKTSYLFPAFWKNGKTHSSSSKWENCEKRWEKYFRYEEGLSLAKQIRAADYLECSALNKIGVREVFEAASKAAIDYKEWDSYITYIIHVYKNKRRPQDLNHQPIT